MSTDEPGWDNGGLEAQAPLRQAFLLAYGLGLLLCVVWPLVLQVILGRVISPSATTDAELAMELGYSFTGLTVLAGLFVVRRWGRIRTELVPMAPEQQSRTILREILLYSALFELSAAYGLVCYAMGGPGAERYGRTFIALPALMFFLFVPRWRKWKIAAGG